ncbi:MAG: SRPBCC domain-containing protein [Alphaproteobacteria bacterium]|jgi:uncharacterized protein YndB with AHSA1/START domain|nr:SRPBCC domain-containing protein [Alphaproteobacteria bacterium]
MTDTAATESRPTARVTRHLSFPPDKVFRAWIDPSIAIRWFGGSNDAPSDVTMDPRVGGAYRITLSPTSRLEGVYRRVDPPRCLIFTWVHVSTLDDGAEKRSLESQVTITFSEVGDGTDVEILHEALTDEAGRAGVTEGWGLSLEKLQTLLSKGA